MHRPAPKEILSLAEFEDRARACLPVATYEYLASGAADENTVRWNREAYDLIRLRPRVLRDVSNVDTTLTLLGRKMDGVSRVIEILRTELAMTMQLLGCRSLEELNSSVLWSSQ